MKYVRKETTESRARNGAHDLPNIVELGEAPLPARELFARYPAIEHRHACAVFFDDMARCYGRHIEAAERDGLFRPLDDDRTVEAMEYFKKELPRSAIGRDANGSGNRFDLYGRQMQAYQEVRKLVADKRLPSEAVPRFIDAVCTLIDGIRRAKLP